MESLGAKREKFERWRAEMSTRIDKWIESLDLCDLNLDFSVNSLENLEDFLINRYTNDDLDDEINRPELDAAASYIGETIINLLGESRWVIYLDDESNIYYGLPCVLTKYSGAVSVHLLLKEILETRSGKVLENRINKIMSYENLIVAQLNKL